MQELTELVTLFRKEAGALGTLRAAVLEPGSKTEQLFDAVLSGKVTSDESAMATVYNCLSYTSPSPRDKRQSRMPSSA